jgi:rhodanese-related sulfurtransferase
VKFKKVLGLIMVLGMLCSMLASCGSGGSTTNNTQPSVNDTTNEFEVIRAAADKFFSGGGADKQITAKELHALLYDDKDPNNDPRIMDNRNNNTYTIGHVCGAMAIPWHQIFVTLTPGSFEDTYFFAHDAESTNEKIVIINYTGMEGGGTLLAALSMLGYDVVKMKWGYNQWQFCPNASPGTFFPASTGLGRMTGLNTSGSAVTGFWAIGQNYPTETTPNTATQTYDFPVINNTDSADPFEIIRAAANQVAQKQSALTAAEMQEGGWEQKHKWWPTDIIPVDLLSSVNSSTPPFIISVQPKDLYDKGHVKGAVWMDIKTICQPENLKKIPTNRKIVVVSNDGMTGTTVSAVLNMLGYTSMNLLFGMTAWTESDVIAPGRFETYEDDMVTFKDILSYEICWIDVPQLEMLPVIEGYVPPILAPVEDQNW